MTVHRHLVRAIAVQFFVALFSCGARADVPEIPPAVLNSAQVHAAGVLAAFSAAWGLLLCAFLLCMVSLHHLNRAEKRIRRLIDRVMEVG